MAKMPILCNLFLFVVLPITQGIEFEPFQLFGNLADTSSSRINNLVNVLSNASKDIVNIPGEIDETLKLAIGEMFDYKNVSFELPSIDSLGITEKCCGKYGCFTTGSLLGFPLCRRLLPLCQDALKIKFYLWTRKNPKEKDIIDPENRTTLINSHFRKTECVFVYINGYLGSGDMFFVRDMKDAILRKRDCMFISVHWVNGARTEYTLAVGNSQMASAVTAYMIQEIMNLYKISPEMFHIVGLSLGAHVASGVGKRIKGIGRITGLDPAKPYFENCGSTMRLSKTDALYVDIMHTDMNGFGIESLSGHADIFVNGGFSQPACFGVVVCNHILAVFYFIDTIEAECPYLAYQCDDQDNFMRGLCSTGCGNGNDLCVPLGYNADRWKDNARESPTLFFMSIGNKKSYCLYHYYVEINCTDDQIRSWRYGRNKDKLLINLIGTDGETGLQPANENSIRYTTLPAITTILTSKIQIGKIVSIRLKWIPSGKVSSTADCQNDNGSVIFEPTAICCVEKFDSVRERCLMCPYIVSSIYAKNLETSSKATFPGRNKPLLPNRESSFDNQQNV